MLDITYEYYTDVYGGSSVEEKNFEFRLRRTIAVCNRYLTVDLFEFDESQYTENQLYRLKTAICAAAECVDAFLVSGSNVTSKAVSSESVGGAWSKSYQVSDSDKDGTAMGDNVQQILIDFLSGSIFMSVGGYYVGC